GACHYPPTGYRSAGGVMTSPGGPFCLIMVESQAALADLDKTLAVPGVDGIYVGPRDLSYSLGCEMAPDDPVFWGALQQIWAACRAAGKPWACTQLTGRPRGCTGRTGAACSMSLQTRAPSAGMWKPSSLRHAVSKQ